MPAKLWDKPRIIQALRKAHQAGGDLSFTTMKATKSGLLCAAVDHFGSYRAAVAAAGIDYTQVHRRPAIWNRRRVADLLRDLHRQGADLRESRVARNVPGLEPAARHYFGSYRKAVLAAGLKYPPTNPGPWTARRVLDAILARSAKGEDLRQGAMLRTDESLVLAAAHYFGSYRAALAKAGLDHSRISHHHAKRELLRVQQNLKYPAPFILAELRRLDAAGADLRDYPMGRKHPRLIGAARRRFGTYRHALLAAGIDPPSPPRRRWEMSEILDGIREVFKTHQRLTSNQARGVNSKLWQVAQWNFGSWEQAVREAGIDPERARPPGREQVLELLRAKHASGADVSWEAMLQVDPPLVRAAGKHFGSYRRALGIAGLGPPLNADSVPRTSRPREGPGFTADAVLAALREKHSAGADLRYRAMYAAHSALVRAAKFYFESYLKALQQAGVAPTTPGRRRVYRWTRDRLIAELRLLHKTGQELSPSAMQKSHSGLESSVRHHFGTYRKGLEAAGIDHEKLFLRQQRWNRSTVIDELRRLHRAGRNLRPAPMLKSKDRQFYAVVRQHFRTWWAGLEAAGIDRRSLPRPGHAIWSQERVVEALKRRQAEGKPLYYSGVDKTDRRLGNAIRHYFEAHDAALQAAGIDPARVRLRPARNRRDAYWTEDLVLQTLRDLHAAGHDLRHRPMKQKSQPLFFAVKDLFGSYVNALKQAGVDYWTMSQDQLARERSARQSSNCATGADPSVVDQNSAGTADLAVDGAGAMRE